MTPWTDLIPVTRAAQPVFLRRFWRLLFGTSALARQRRQLGQLDDAMLRDIGLTRDEALRESRRARWDPPSHWLG